MATEAQIRLAYEFFTDDNMSSYTSQVATMEASKTMNSQPSIVWRSTTHTVGSIPDQEFVYNLTTLRPISFVLIYNNNLSLDSTVQVIIATDAAFTNQVYNNTWTGTDPIYGYGEQFYGLTGYGGYDDEGFVFPFFAKYFDMVVGQYIKIIISNSSNSDGFIQAGRIACGSYFEPEFNINWGYSLSFEDLSKQTDMRNAGIRTEVLGNRRIMNMSHDRLLLADELELVRMRQVAGKDKNVFVSIYQGDGSTQEQIHTLLGFLTTDLQFTENSVNFRSTSLTIKEAK